MGNFQHTNQEVSICKCHILYTKFSLLEKKYLQNITAMM